MITEMNFYSILDKIDIEYLTDNNITTDKEIESYINNFISDQDHPDEDEIEENPTYDDDYETIKRISIIKSESNIYQYNLINPLLFSKIRDIIEEIKSECDS